VPAASFQLEASGGELPYIVFFAAVRADGEGRVAYLLQMLFLKAARSAAVFVNGHDESQNKKVIL
jgi:hypothetical protein